MDSKQIRRLVAGTADAAFAVDVSGLIGAWNTMAEELFGLSSKETIGRGCHEILQGNDDAGRVCSKHCAIQQAVQENRPVANFDLQIHTKQGSQWCGVSVLIVTEPEFASPHAVHIIQPRAMRKRLQQLLRNFMVNETELRPKLASQFVSALDRQSLLELLLLVRRRSYENSHEALTLTKSLNNSLSAAPQSRTTSVIFSSNSTRIPASKQYVALSNAA
jgi:PAS domain S-box-containing protein